MQDTIIDAVIRQIKEDLRYNETEALEEMLKLLYSKKTHEIFLNYLPEDIWENYENYDESE
jgi:anaerobic ribonucleoside-triphosphate reductase